MKICQEVTNKEVWEGFLSGREEKTFLQSWNWGEFQQKMGHKIWRLGIFENESGGDPTSAALAVKIVAKRGIFLLVQHGPAFAKASTFAPWASADKSAGEAEILLNKLKEIAKEENCSFIRVASLLSRNEENKKLFQGLGFREAPMHANAYEATWKLKITVPEDEILKNMRKTTRYLIRQAMKNPDITIEKSPAFAEATAGKDKIEDIEIYQKLNNEVAKRQNFASFSDEYIKNEFEIFTKDNQAALFLGKYKGEPVAGALVIFWSGVGFYHQAALDPKYHKIPVAYLLQWEAIKEAKRRGCKLYDFWGYVDPGAQPKHPWAGPTLFKMGFGGRAYEYVKTQDFPLSKKYWLTYFFEKLRKIKRGL